jgi:probable selenium-dependent hydroxylase accessory protein YqeC
VEVKILGRSFAASCLTFCQNLCYADFNKNRIISEVSGVERGGRIMGLPELLCVEPGVTAVVGSGGKTTLVRAIGEAMMRRGSTVLLCTTTHIMPFEGLRNLYNPPERELITALREERILCIGTPGAEGRRITMPKLSINRLAELADFVIVEADGAHRKPLKAHASYEPAIPEGTNHTVCVVGISGLGQPISEVVHRPEIFARLSGTDRDATIESVARVLNVERVAERYFLNQADTPERWEWARCLAALLDRPAVAGSLQKEMFFPC